MTESSAAVLAKASPKHSTWRTGLLKMPGMRGKPSLRQRSSKQGAKVTSTASVALLTDEVEHAIVALGDI
jgi:hypothetical protein